MKERPILFSGEMVRAILDGRKTQTRRVVKPQPFRRAICGTNGVWYDADCINPGTPIPMRYGHVGDRLWVKEAHYFFDGAGSFARFKTGRVWYRADGLKTFKWRPSIFMPRWASRVTLEITGVRVERLQEISDDDAKAEGIEGRWHPDDNRCWTWKDYRRSQRLGEDIYHYGSLVTPRSTYEGLWDSINGKKHSWESNPFCWVIEFKRL